MGTLTTAATLAALEVGSNLLEQKQKAKRNKQQRMINEKNKINLLEKELAAKRARIGASNMSFSGSGSNLLSSTTKDAWANINAENSLMASGLNGQIQSSYMSSLTSAGKKLLK